MTAAERARDVARQLGYEAPRGFTDHAVDRWIERHVGGDLSQRQWRRYGPMWRGEKRRLLRMMETAALIEVLHREKQSAWRLDTGAIIVAAQDGDVKTVLPPWSERPGNRGRRPTVSRR